MSPFSHFIWMSPTLYESTKLKLVLTRYRTICLVDRSGKQLKDLVKCKSSHLSKVSVSDMYKMHFTNDSPVDSFHKMSTKWLKYWTPNIISLTNICIHMVQNKMAANFIWFMNSPAYLITKIFKWWLALTVLYVKKLRIFKMV